MKILRAPDGGNLRDRATFEAWGGPLPLDFYLAAVGRLRRHDWSREHADVWLLVSDTGEELSSCEAYRMDATLPDGAGGHAYAIGNMYTEPALRGRGFATELLSMLALLLAREDPATLALVLFSDVALKTYEKSGFQARPALCEVRPALPGAPAAQGLELLKEGQAAQALAQVPVPRAGFTVLPSPGQIDWHLEREWIFAELFQRPRPAACGARTRDGLVLWCADFVKEQLDILLLHAPAPGDAETLLACAARVAGAAGLTKVVQWRTRAEEFAGGGTLVDRLDTLDSVPMLLPLDGRVKAEDWNWIPKAIWV